MDIPESIKLRETLHGSGAKGMAIYGYADTGGLGVRMEARRKDGRSPFIETWFFDALPGREFASFKALRDAVLPLTPEQIAAETADKYPLIRDAEPDSCGNACRLCPRPAYVPGQERVKYDTWRVTLAYSWKDEHPVSLCDAHMEQFEADPKGLRAAIEQEVELRRQRAKANGFPWPQDRQPTTPPAPPAGEN